MASDINRLTLFCSTARLLNLFDVIMPNFNVSDFEYLIINENDLYVCPKLNVFRKLYLVLRLYLRLYIKFTLSKCGYDFHPLVIASLTLPLFLRLFNTFRPALESILFRNPCFLFPFFTFGCQVLLGIIRQNFSIKP